MFIPSKVFQPSLTNTSLVQKFINYRHKKFYNIGPKLYQNYNWRQFKMVLNQPGINVTKLFCVNLLTLFNKLVYFINKSVIMIVFHSVETKHRSLVSPSENACACKAASVAASMRSGSRSSKLPFLPYQSKLENVAVFFCLCTFGL